MSIDVRAVSAEQHGEIGHPFMTALGQRPMPERIEQEKRIPELDVRIGAYEGDALVGSAAAFNVMMTTPGGSVATSGLIMVGVLATHRRRGILKALMRRHLDDARGRGQSVAVLWATEANIYGRFGYGMASECCSLAIDRDRSAFDKDAGSPRGPEPAVTAKLLGEEEALRVLPGIWDRVRRVTPGMLSRSEAWWQVRLLRDWDEPGHAGGPLLRALISVEGQPEAYALYRAGHRWDEHQLPCGTLQVVEAVGATPRGTRLVWRYLFDVDLMQRVETLVLPVDHPLLLLIAEPRRLRLRWSDALYLRIVDVEPALAARGYGSSDHITLEIEDAFCPWNAGRFRIDGGAGRSARTDDPAELRLDISALGSAYLGGISFRRLADAGRIEELAPGSVERADALFRSARAPWCPEIF